jgi:hypothetical protein
MAHIVLTLAEWHAVSHELRGTHYEAAPAGLNERLQAFFQDTPRTWQDQPFAIDLDATSIEAVWAMHAIVTSNPPVPSDRQDGVLAAMHILYLHQHPDDDSAPVS